LDFDFQRQIGVGYTWRQGHIAEIVAWIAASCPDARTWAAMRGKKA